jgi:uncharacterized protein (TIGR00297 family)
MSNIIILPLLLLAAMLGYWQKVLTISGAIGTILVGCAVAFSFELNGLYILALFFLSSSFWSMYKKEQKVAVEEKLEKNERRDFTQVMANGGVALLAAILFAISESGLFLGMFIASIAAANSDTWASELGVLSKSRPRIIWTWKKTDPGTSGAVSLLGLFAAFTGAGSIAVAATVLFSLDMIYAFLFTLIGFLGSLIDTVLGAKVQSNFKCKVCGLETEKKIHCENKTDMLKGFSWMSNDTVNFIASLLAGLLGAILFM